MLEYYLFKRSYYIGSLEREAIISHRYNETSFKAELNYKWFLE